MKKFLLMLGAVALMTACSDDGGGYQEFDHNEIYKHLSSVNIRDAKMIYTKEGVNTRSVGSETFGGIWKIDHNGIESKLIITGSDGKTNILNIYEIHKLSDKILLMFPDYYDTNRIIQEWYNSHSDDPVNIGVSNEPHGAATEYAMLLNRENEKLYRFPENVSIPFDYDNIFTDKQDNIYYKSYEINGDQILKLSPETMTIEALLPDDIRFDNFSVTEDGFIVYWSGIEQQENCRIKCPGGRIYPVSDNNTFILNGNLYSIRESENTIIRYKTVGNNDIEEETVCQMPEETEFYGYYRFIPNYVRNTMLITDSYEFDGETCTKLENPVYVGDITTSKAWYSRKLHSQKQQWQTIRLQNFMFRITKYKLFPQAPQVRTSRLQDSDILTEPT